MGWVTVFVLLMFGLIIWVFHLNTIAKARFEEMSPAERATFTFGALNEHLVCPHCQTKGLVRAKQVQRTATSVGTVGGIMKAKTSSQTTAVVAQHHCDQCSTTWDI